MFEALEASPPQRFEFIEKFVRALQLVDLAAHELFASAPVLRHQTRDDEDLDVLLHRGEADRIQPAEFADRALTVERLRDDVAPCCIAEREEQPVGPTPSRAAIASSLPAPMTP